MVNPNDTPWMREYMADYDEGKYKEDVQYMKSLYMPMSMEILSYVGEELDKLEYEGSMMFDEYPDRTAMQKIAGAVYDKAKYLENMYQPVMEEDEAVNVQEHCTSCRGRESWLENLIWVILGNEMHYRRRRYFKRRGRR